MMSAVPYSQEIIFLTSVLGGVLLGLLWDFYRLLRHYIPLGKVGTALGDIVYWIISLYVGLSIIINISWGNVRLFILIGFLIGALVYFYIFSSIILNLCITLINFVIQAIIKIYGVIIFPIKFIIKRLKFFLIPYKMKVDTKIQNKKKEIKFYIYKHKQNVEVKKKQKLKKKKIKKLMREQQKNAQKFKNNKAASKK